MQLHVSLEQGGKGRFDRQKRSNVTMEAKSDVATSQGSSSHQKREEAMKRFPLEPLEGALPFGRS